MAINFKQSISDPVAVDVGNYVTQGRVVSKTIKFASFTTNRNAVWAANQQLQKESYPFATLSIVVNRNIFRLQVGDCFKFSHSGYGVSNMICRVLQLSEDSLDSEEITVTAIEDVFGISKARTTHTDRVRHATSRPTYDLSPFIYQTVIETPYVLSDSIKVIPIACRVDDLDLGFDVHISIDEGASYIRSSRLLNLRPYGTLVSAYSADTYTIDSIDGFQIDFVDDADLIETVTWADLFSGAENFAYLGEEIISFRTFTPVTSSIYALGDIIRGRFGTERIAHSAGEDFYHLDIYTTSINNPEITTGAERKFKLVPYNIKYLGEISDATAINLTITGLCKTPYRPTNFLANDGSYAARYSSDVILTWTPRYRGKGAGIGIPGTVLAETDWEGYFEIEVWVGGSLVRTITAINAVTYTYTSGMNTTDNGSLADEITFKLLNYRTEDGIVYESNTTTVVCKKE